jgi:hypothetical protein
LTIEELIGILLDKGDFLATYVTLIPVHDWGAKRAFLWPQNFEKGSGPKGTGTGSGTLKNPSFCKVSGTSSRWNPKFEKWVPEPVIGNSKF